MYNSYSQIRKLLGITVDRKTDDGLASLTHYLQCYSNGVSNHFRGDAANYLERLPFEDTNSSLKVEDLIPVEWDIPFPPPKNPAFTFVDLFAGVGGIRLAYQNLGGKCVFSSEWNSFAKQTYERNFGEVPFGDIRAIEAAKIPDHDILVAGFPCQPFSIAGVTKKNALGRHHGFLDETQGTLFFDIARVLREKQPPAFMLENVKNLFTHDKKNTFKVIAGTLDELGYSVHAKILDGQCYVPQHRERIIIVGFRRDVFGGWENFYFPTPEKSSREFREILEPQPDPKYTLTDHLWAYLQNYALKHKAKGNGFGFGMTDLKGISRTLSARYYKDGAEILIPQEGKNPRRLTPRECARLQGFPDCFEIPVSDNQAYKQFGNSVVVPLIEKVGANIVSIIKEKIRGTI